MIHPLIRLYFNRRGELPWSIDTGPGTEEIQTGAVVTLATGKTVFAPEAGDNENSPTAWIEFAETSFEETLGGVLIGSPIVIDIMKAKASGQ